MVRTGWVCVLRQNDSPMSGHYVTLQTSRREQPIVLFYGKHVSMVISFSVLQKHTWVLVYSGVCTEWASCLCPISSIPSVRSFAKEDTHSFSFLFQPYNWCFIFLIRSVSLSSSSSSSACTSKGTGWTLPFFGLHGSHGAFCCFFDHLYKRGRAA